ncbi:MAG: hypothetical protein VZQ78_10395, partial [Prevotella sp.]|nr:hypothetical protein [Prevotella sp.]
YLLPNLSAKDYRWGYETPCGSLSLTSISCYGVHAGCRHTTEHVEVSGGAEIAATPHTYMLSTVRKGINEWRIQVARKLISFEIDSISPEGQSLPTL